MKLTVICKEDAQDVLANFPFGSNQFLESEEYVDDNNLSYEFVELTVELGGSDLTTAQEQHLDTNNDVINYFVK